MKTLSVRLDDDLDAALDTVSAEQGRAKADLIREILRKYIETHVRHAVERPAVEAEPA